MKKIDLTCPKCGANMEFDAEKHSAVCKFCRHVILLEKNETIEVAARRAMEVSYATTDGKNRANEDAEIRKKKQETRKKLLVVAVIFGILCIAGMISYFSKGYIENPFENVTVEFSGINGNGRAKISYTNGKNNDITYKLDKDSKLSNNEKIRLTATSDKYRFKSDEKELQVTGLLNYISSLAELTDSVKKLINDKSAAFQKEKVEDTYSFSGTITELNPYKTYLGVLDNGNRLFDIFELKIKTKSGNVYSKYVVTVYSNILITDDENSMVKYDRMANIGSSIAAGDPKSYNAFSSNYAGFITGFTSLDDIDNYISSKYDVNMKLYK